ncbi:MAG: hypothetical protein ACPGVK_01425 [Halocynthiibacter sp.]
MALPLVPIAGFVARYGAVALAAYAVTRKVEQARFSQKADDALDDIDEGVTYGRRENTHHGTARFMRVIRLGDTGPGLKIDARSLFKISIRKV